MNTFASIAQEYIRLVESDTQSITEWFQHLQKLLPTLYSAALDLPDVESTDEETEDLLTQEQWNQLFLRLRTKMGSWNNYQKMFNPYESFETSLVVGDLADDVADIYRDLHAGANLWQRGLCKDAIWIWKFDFLNHWGQHALSALYAIHTIAFTYYFSREGEELPIRLGNSEGNGTL